MSSEPDERQRGWEERWSRPDFAARWRTESIPAEIREAAEDGWFPAGASVLDIGCGGGEIAAWLAHQGYQVVGADFSEAAIAMARAAHPDVPGLTFEVLDISRRAPGSGKFDAFLDRGCLHNVEHERRVDYVRNVVTAARPGARFLLLAPRPDRDRDGWVRYLEELFWPEFEVVRSADTVFARPADESDEPVRIGTALWMIRRQPLIHPARRRDEC